MAFGNPNRAIVKQPYSRNLATNLRTQKGGFVSPFPFFSGFLGIASRSNLRFRLLPVNTATQLNTSQFAERNLKETCDWLVARC